MTIDDHLLISPCTDQDSRSEKPARGALFTALQRHLSNDHIVIVDSLNYIKGFRYQMYCAAREAKIRVCTVRERTSLTSHSVSLVESTSVFPLREK